VDVLHVSADRLQGAPTVPAVERLETARREAADAILVHVGRQRPGPSDRTADTELAEALAPSLRLRALSYAGESVAYAALEATGGPAPDADEGAGEPAGGGDAERPTARSPWWARHAGIAYVMGYVSPRSIWFRNSVRGAVGLSIAVLVAHVAHLHNAFWVVLATLSVLRSNALGTSATVVREVAGTVIGVVVGAIVIIAIGPHQVFLWALLPVAVFLAGYAPGGLSFGAGQAAFSLLVLILFNLIMPVGWQVGFIRVEDVLVGCSISLVTGAMLWPRGALAVLTRNLSTAYARGIDFVAYAVDRCLDVYVATPEPSHSAVSDQAASGAVGPVLDAPSAHAARTAGQQVDDAFRHYLTDRHARPEMVASMAALVTGAARVRLAGHSLARLADAGALDAPGGRAAAGERSLLEPDSRALHAWYGTLSRALVGGAEVPAPDPRDPNDHARVLWCLRLAAGQEYDRTRPAADLGTAGTDSVAGRGAAIRPTLRLIWAHQQLDELWDLETRLVEPASQVIAGGRRRSTSR
jgi:Fusaric acid resistance protein-like